MSALGTHDIRSTRDINSIQNTKHGNNSARDVKGVIAYFNHSIMLKYLQFITDKVKVYLTHSTIYVILK